MRKLQQILGLSFQLIVFVLFVNIVFAIPGVPHQFYGEVKINRNLAPDGVGHRVWRDVQHVSERGGGDDRHVGGPGGRVLQRVHVAIGPGPTARRRSAGGVLPPGHAE